MKPAGLREAAEAVIQALDSCGCNACGNFSDTNQVAALRAALAQPDEGVKHGWDAYMSEVHPCGHTEAQHQYYFDGSWEADKRCDVLDAFDGRKLSMMVLREHADTEHQIHFPPSYLVEQARKVLKRTTEPTEHP